MESPPQFFPGGMRTPIEPSVAPCAGWDEAGWDEDGSGRQAVFTTAFCRVEAAVASSRGPRHACNEDAHAGLEDAGRLFVVADGVGGGAVAHVASRLLVAQLKAALGGHRLDPVRVRHAMLEADRNIARTIALQTNLPGAATVVLCGPVDVFASKWLIGWVGDCRAYRLPARADSGIDLLTRDDTFRELGELPPHGGSVDDPARMVGNGATVGANVAIHELQSDDLLALCSDGVHKHLEAGDWERVLRQPVPLVRRCEALITSARANGSDDDATVLLLHRTGSSIRLPRWMTRFSGCDADGGPSR